MTGFYVHGNSVIVEESGAQDLIINRRGWGAEITLRNPAAVPVDNQYWFDFSVPIPDDVQQTLKEVSIGYSTHMSGIVGDFGDCGEIHSVSIFVETSEVHLLDNSPPLKGVNQTARLTIPQSLAVNSGFSVSIGVRFYNVRGSILFTSVGAHFYGHTLYSNP
jgi:hypothetical protein